MYEQSRNLAGIIFREPVTAVTDFVLVVMCLFFVSKLKNKSAEPLLQGAWKNFFLIFAASVCLGGFNHLFRYYLEGNPYQILWMIMNLLSHIIVYYGQLIGLRTLSADDSLKSSLNKKYERLFLALMFVFMGLSLLFWDYKVVKINSAIGLILMFVCNLISHYRQKRVGTKTIAIGIFISFSTLVVHGFKLSFCEWFNFNDISHVIMMVSLYFMFRGAKEMLNKNLA